MTLQTSGAISLANLQSEFGGSNPISISEYYKNGSYVPSSVSTTVSAYDTTESHSYNSYYGNGDIFWRYYENGSGFPTRFNQSTYLMGFSFWTDQAWTSGTGWVDASMRVDRTGNYKVTIGGYNTGASRGLTVYRNGSVVGTSGYGTVNFSASEGDLIRIYATMNTIGNYNACDVYFQTELSSRTLNATVNNSIPTSGVIQLDDFYGGKKTY